MRIAAVSAADVSVDYEWRVAVECDGLILHEIGHLRINAVRDAQAVEAVNGPQVDAAHFFTARIGGLGRQIINVAAQWIPRVVLRPAERMRQVGRIVAKRQFR